MVTTSGLYTRRTLLRVTAGAALAGAGGSLLSACGSSGGSGTTAAAAASTARVGGPFNIYTFGGYEGKGIIDDWYRENGIQLKAKAVSTPGTIPATIRQGGWDAATVNQGDAEYYYDLGIASEITVDEVPSLATMLPFFRDSEFFKLRDGVYNAVPWTWGPIAFMARSDRLPKGTIHSYWDLTRPEFKGRLGTYDDGMNMVATGAVAQQLDPSKLTTEQLEGPVREYLEKLMPNLKVLAASLGDEVNTLAAGDVDGYLVGFPWAVTEVQKQKVDAYFEVPEKEGAFGFIDAVFIPKDAPNRQNAVAYCNALMEGRTSLAMAEALVQLSTNPATNEKVSKRVRDLYPEDLATYTSDTLKWNKSYHDPDGPYATIRQWTDLWEQVKAKA